MLNINYEGDNDDNNDNKDDDDEIHIVESGYFWKKFGPEFVLYEHLHLKFNKIAST